MLECLTFTFRPAGAGALQTDSVASQWYGELLHFVKPATQHRGLWVKQLLVGDHEVVREVPLHALYEVPLLSQTLPGHMVAIELQSTEALPTTHLVRLLMRRRNLQSERRRVCARCGGDLQLDMVEPNRSCCC